MPGARRVSWRIVNSGRAGEFSQGGNLLPGRYFRSVNDEQESGIVCQGERG